VADFRVKDPSEVIKDKYPKRALMKYKLKQVKKGAVFWDIKPPKTGTVDKSEIFDLLKAV